MAASAEQSGNIEGNEKSSSTVVGRQDTSDDVAAAAASRSNTDFQLPSIDSISTNVFPPPPGTPPSSATPNGVSHASTPQKAQNPYAFVTLVMINEDYVQAAIVLAASIRGCFKEATDAFASGNLERVAPFGGFPPLSRLPDLVVMVDAAVGDKARRALSEFFDRVVEVTIIEADALQCGKQGGAYNAHLYENWISASFTKFHFIGFEEYRRVMFLDADQLLMSDITHLFRTPVHVRLQRQQKQCNGSEGPHAAAQSVEAPTTHTDSSGKTANGSTSTAQTQDVRVQTSAMNRITAEALSQDVRKHSRRQTTTSEQDSPPSSECQTNELPNYDNTDFDDMYGPGGVECPAAICSAIGTDRDGIAKFGRDKEMHGRLLSPKCVRHAIDECYGMRGSIMLLEPNKEHLREIQALLKEQGYYGSRTQGHLGADERLMSEKYLNRWHHLHHRYGWISWRPQDTNDVAPTVIHFLTAKPWSWSDETWPDFRVWNEAARRLLARHPDVAPHFRRLQESVGDDATLPMHALYASVNRTLLSERKKKEEEEHRKLQQRRDYRGIASCRPPPVRRTRSYQELEKNWRRADGSRVNLRSGAVLRPPIGGGGGIGIGGSGKPRSFTAAMISLHRGPPRLTASKSVGAYVPPHLRKKRVSTATATAAGGISALSEGSSPMNLPPSEASSSPLLLAKPFDPFPNKPRQHRHSLRSPLSKSPSGVRAQKSPPMTTVSMHVSITAVTRVRASPNSVSVSRANISLRGNPGAPSDLHLPPSAVSQQRNGEKPHVHHMQSQTRPRADAAFVNNNGRHHSKQGGDGGETSVGNAAASLQKGQTRLSNGGNNTSSSRFGGSGGKASSRFGGSSGNSPLRFGGNSRTNSPKLSPQQHDSGRFSGKKPPTAKSDTTPRPSSRDEGTLSSVMAAAAAQHHGLARDNAATGGGGAADAPAPVQACP